MKKAKRKNPKIEKIGLRKKNEKNKKGNPIEK